MSNTMAGTAPMGMDMAQAMMQAQNARAANTSLAQGANTPAGSKEEKAAEKAKEFEAMFVTQMLNHMFSGIKTEGPFSGGRAEEIWRSFMITEYGKSIADAGGIGIAQHVKQHLLSLQEG